MALKLNKDREHSVVFPPENGAHFMQGSFYFDQNGEIVKHPELFDEKAAAKLKRVEALEVAKIASRDAHRKALADAGVDPDSTPDESEEDEAEEEKKVDLRAWLRGDLRLIFPHVQTAIKEQFGHNATSKAAAIEFLVAEEGLVEPEQVNVR